MKSVEVFNLNLKNCAVLTAVIAVLFESLNHIYLSIAIFACLEFIMPFYIIIYIKRLISPNLMLSFAAFCVFFAWGASSYFWPAVNPFPGRFQRDWSTERLRLRWAILAAFYLTAFVAAALRRSDTLSAAFASTPNAYPASRSFAPSIVAGLSFGLIVFTYLRLIFSLNLGIFAICSINLIVLIRIHYPDMHRLRPSLRSSNKNRTTSLLWAMILMWSASFGLEILPVVGLEILTPSRPVDVRWPRSIR